MKLFGHPESGHAFKVRLCLAIADIKHDYEVIDIFSPRDSRPEEFKRHSRFGEVPMLLDNDQAFVQSNAILLHIAESFGIMGSQDPNVLYRCREWLFWEANKIGMCLPQLRSAHRYEDANINKQAYAWLLARYEHDVNVIDSELADGRAFIVADEPTIADCSLCGYLYFADEAQVQVPTRVQAWLDRIAALEGWAHPYELLKAS